MGDSGRYVRETFIDVDLDEVYALYPNLFSICLHSGGVFTSPPNRSYDGGNSTFVDLVDIDKFSIHELDLMLDMLGYSGRVPRYYQFLYPEKNLDNGLEHLSSDQDCLNLAQHVAEHKLIHVYVSHGINNIKALFISPSRTVTIEEIDEPGPYALVPLKLNFDQNVGQSSGAGQGQTSGAGQGQSSGAGVNSVGDVHDDISVEVGVDVHDVKGVEVGADVHVDKGVEFGVESEKLGDLAHGGGVSVDIGVEAGAESDKAESDQAAELDEGSSSDGYHASDFDDLDDLDDLNEGSKDIGDGDQAADFDEGGGGNEDESDDDYIVDPENNMTDPEVDMSDYRMNVDSDVEDGFDFGNEQKMDLGEDVIDNDKFLSGSESDENETSSRKHILHGIRRSTENMANFYLGQIFGKKEEAKKLIRKHAVETRRLIKIIKDDHLRVRAVCTGSKPDFEVDDGGLHASKVKKTKDKGASGKISKGKGTVVKKGKPKGGGGTRAESNVGGRGKRTNPKEYQCPWVLLLSKEKDSQSWVVRTLNTNHTCIQSRHIYACTSTFLSEQILEEIEEDPNMSLKAVQGQFRRKYGVSVHKMKAYRAKMKAKKRVEGDYKEQYSLLREYAAELIDKNPGSTVKIEVEPPTDPESTTRQFKRIYVCLAALKNGFKALNRDLLGLDGAFMKGTFPGQMLTAVGLDSNNGIYPVCYAIVESESNSSWTWFLELMSEDLEI